MSNEEIKNAGNNSVKDEKAHLTIHVNRKRKNEEDGVTNKMTVDAIAKLVGETSESANVQELQGESGKAGPVLSGDIEIKNGMHFSVTRKKVEGGNK